LIAVFKPHPQSEARKRSAVILIEYLLAEKRGEVLPTHKRELLDVLLWKISLAESSKYKTRFQSQAALKCKQKTKSRHGKTKLIHDHVFQRAKMIAKLEKAKPDKIDVILKNAFGCTVTIKENSRLSKFDKEYDGWARYQKAKIKVINTETDKEVDY